MMSEQQAQELMYQMQTLEGYFSQLAQKESSIISIIREASAAIESLKTIDDKTGGESLIPALEQIIKQLNKLIDVIHASEHDPQNTVIRELALIKVKVTDKNRTEVLQVVDHFDASTIDFSDKHLLVQLTAESDRIDSFIQMLEKYGLQEMVRTGKIVATKGAVET